MLFGLLKRKKRVLRLERAKLPQIKVICPHCLNHSTWMLPTGCWIELTAPFVFACSCGMKTEINVPYIEQETD
jgi:hypothetical protein